MPDRERILEALSICLPETEDDSDKSCAECSYCESCFNNLDAVGLPVRMVEDFRTLLKAEPKRGRWIYHDDDYYPWLECSECHWDYSGLKRHRYCSNCGAKMDGDSDGQEG